MPICEADPWRVQYFTHAGCPPDVNIPTEDGDAYLWYPRYKWLYNKLAVAESQGLPCAPHGIDPPSFPVFSKPIYNMRGMGAGSRVIRSLKEYKQAQRPGHMWMELLQGEHISTDVAVVEGEARWSRHSRGIAIGDGMFDYWIVEAARRTTLETYIEQWIATNLAGYTGMINIETIGDRIIETHLRFSDQWPDLYGAGWVEALVGLYRDKNWVFDEFKPARWLLGRAVRPARHPVSASTRGSSGRTASHAGRHQYPDHLPRGSVAGRAFDAAGWLPPRDRQHLGARDRRCGARKTRAQFLVDATADEAAASCSRQGDLGRGGQRLRQDSIVSE